MLLTPATRTATALPVAGRVLGWVAVAASVGVVTAKLVPLDRLALPVAVVGTLAVAAQVRAARDAALDARRTWACLAGATALWVLALLGAASGWSAPLVWGWLRGAALVVTLAAVLLARGARRGVRGWAMLLLDGSAVGLAAFVVFWIVLRSSPASTGDWDGVHPALLWLPGDLVAASLVTGLGVRAGAGVRVPSVLVVVAAVGTAASDAAWVLTGYPGSGTGGWVAVLVLLAAAGRVGGPLWRAEPEGSRPVGPGRLSQVLCAPAVALALVARHDVVTVGATAVLLAALALQIGVVHRQNLALWAAVALQARRLDDLLADSRDALLQVAPDGRVEFASEAVRDLLGVSPRELVGGRLAERAHPDDDTLDGAGETFAPLLEHRTDSVVVRARLQHVDGTWRHTESVVSLRDGGATPGLTISLRDTTVQERMAAEVRRQARTDSLTGVTSRAAFLALVDERLAAGPAVVLFVDLDGFKSVNDTAGHAVGDRLLRDVAAALERAAGPDDVVARLGGDEFAVLGAGGTAAAGLELAAAVLRSLRLAGRERDPRAAGTDASIGVAVGAGGSAESLLGDADLAMYAAKAAGGARAVAFEPRMRTEVVERSRLVTALDTALGTGTGLALHVQPIVDLTDRNWVGFEALVRWEAPGGHRTPRDFLSVAEETGQIVPLGRWVLGQALGWLAGCGDRVAGVSVNVAGRQLADPAFPASVVEALEDSGVDPARLTLEVTEQTAIDDMTRTGARLQSLRALGVHVSLDDFGTGFSSLGYLAQLPVDELKIDRRFVAGLGVRAEDDALVRAVLRLAADLGLAVVAEGVETAEQARALAALGCRRAQGFHLQRPVPAASLGFPPARGAASPDPAAPVPRREAAQAQAAGG
ncbi:bifunctional diguanylate cyclase/phosphodiesterase [Kineosporia sp. A_224]|uniref:putative bifunctional diguanylate cyclase/phosphodiesterase n=1 Tax=Kineosporia sp. A_224 TaxID=1962180 RepID=UPI000B4A8F65|nr:sensor domain-containing phosphodiesterase [Kineosporia sp. A_224]